MTPDQEARAEANLERFRFQLAPLRLYALWWQACYRGMTEGVIMAQDYSKWPKDELRREWRKRQPERTSGLSETSFNAMSGPRIRDILTRLDALSEERKGFVEKAKTHPAPAEPAGQERDCSACRQSYEERIARLEASASQWSDVVSDQLGVFWATPEEACCYIRQRNDEITRLESALVGQAKAARQPGARSDRIAVLRTLLDAYESTGLDQLLSLVSSEALKGDL